MKVYRAYKTELDPNNVQRTALLSHAGAARFAYNWGLEQKQEAWAERKAAIEASMPTVDAPKVPTAVDLHRKLNTLKKMSIEEGGVPWMYKVSKASPQEALRDLDKAFHNFFRRCKQESAQKGFPKFKSRKRGIGSFRLTGSIKATKTHIQLPRLGLIRLKEHGYLLSPEQRNARILSATVSERAGRWFVSLQVEQEVVAPRPSAGHVIGVDVGINHLAVTSDGEVYLNPRNLKAAEAKLRLLQRSMSRKVKGSANRKKAVVKLARQHYQVICRRSDAIHKVTSAITKRCGTVVIENLNVAGMVKNRCLAKAISDASMAELHRQIKYKMSWVGGCVVEADRFYPSSKTCSCCGTIKDKLRLSERTYACGICGLKIDRDLNAAINLKNLAASSAVTACGEESSSSACQVKLSSVKQEPNTRTYVLHG